MKTCLHTVSVAVFVTVLLLPIDAKAVDEIQVYNAEIAAPGQWTIQQHLNYVGRGQKEPPFAGGFGLLPVWWTTPCLMLRRFRTPQD